ncbi:aldehyde dehydrogenase family protein [Mycolicibacterium litorale]|uniref:aldehyde dehydrogenase family protein n=1 Tax=Mycolicibacterium litorale TaxID=758802 RepID=UPI003CF83948
MGDVLAGLPTDRLFIDGDWVTGRPADRFETHDPATGRLLAEVAGADESDVDAAVDAARRAFERGPWARMMPTDRANILWRIGELIEQHGAEIAELETRDQGAPVEDKKAFDVANAAAHFRYYAGWCTKLDGQTLAVSVPDVTYETRRIPVGVCALITPWNVPLMMAAWKLGPALAAGNTVVLKPAEQAPLSTLRLAQLCEEAGLPTGVLNVLTGGPVVGKALVRHPGVDKVSFTGSVEVGRDIHRVASDTFKRLSLELGGKAPSVIAPDADIDTVVRANLASGLINAGQTCAAYTRFYVHSTVVDEFGSKMAEAAQHIRLGNGLDASTEMGPLVSQEHLDRVDGYVRKGISEGATLLTGGARAGGDLSEGFFYEPTIFTDVKDDMAIVRDEIFGPVLSILSFDDIDDVVARANDSRYGLNAAVWTRDLTFAKRVSEGIRAGAVYINSGPLQDPAAPWGGMRSSGIGREMGREGINAYTEVKGIWTSFA